MFQKVLGSLGGGILDVRSKGHKNAFIQKIINLLYIHTHTNTTHTCSLIEKCPPKDNVLSFNYTWPGKKSG